MVNIRIAEAQSLQFVLDLTALILCLLETFSGLFSAWNGVNRDLILRVKAALSISRRANCASNLAMRILRPISSIHAKIILVAGNGNFGCLILARIRVFKWYVVHVFANGLL